MKLTCNPYLLPQYDSISHFHFLGFYTRTHNHRVNRCGYPGMSGQVEMTFVLHRDLEKNIAFMNQVAYQPG